MRQCCRACPAANPGVARNMPPCNVMNDVVMHEHRPLAVATAHRRHDVAPKRVFQHHDVCPTDQLVNPQLELPIGPMAQVEPKIDGRAGVRPAGCERPGLLEQPVKDWSALADLDLFVPYRTAATAAAKSLIVPQPRSSSEDPLLNKVQVAQRSHLHRHGRANPGQPPP
jgi:hypothetical protein